MTLKDAIFAAEMLEVPPKTREALDLLIRTAQYAIALSDANDAAKKAYKDLTGMACE